MNRETTIQQELLQKKNELSNFINYLSEQLKLFDQYDYYSSLVGKCKKYLGILCEIIDKVSTTQPSFGGEGFLHEIEKLFTESINSLKTVYGDFNNDLSEESKVTSLENVLKSIGKMSFLKRLSDWSYVENIEIQAFANPIPDIPIEILFEYLEVGDVLKNDEMTLSILEEVQKLHSEANGRISAYTTIIGPSLIGKTQVAFTLSHLINVIYVNFASLIEGSAVAPQKIYSLFKGITTIFQNCIKIDTAFSEFSESDQNAEDILNLDFPLQTLGLIYALLRTRKLRELEDNFDVKNWLTEIVNIRIVMIPPMKISEFRVKTRDIQFAEQLVFIDELPVDQSDIDIQIKFLRNLCRTVALPSIISGTNSRANYLFNQVVTCSASRVEESEPKPWVQVNVKTPKASFLAICKLVKFKNHAGAIVGLTEFIYEEDLCELDYSQLMRNIYGREANETELECFKKLAKFLIEQSKTSLPGIIQLVFGYLLENISLCGNPKELWKQIILQFGSSIYNRKPSMESTNGLLASAHISTFDSAVKKNLENESFSAKLVENHLFYHGTREDVSFRLNIGRDELMDPDILAHGPRIICFRDGLPYEDKCHFPELSEDFLTTFVSLNVWKIVVIDPENSRYVRLQTLANMYEDYLKKLPKFYLGVSKIVQDSFALEVLSHWSISHASHQDFNGETGGVEVFKEFIKNLQTFKKTEGSDSIPFNFTGLDSLPENLCSLLSRIQVPYLMRFPVNDNGATRNLLMNRLGAFIKIGDSWIPEDKIGWDVNFDMEFDGDVKTGSIECKLWNEAVGFASFYKYYQKACGKGYPLSFLVCRKLQKSVSAPTATENLKIELNKRTTTQNIATDVKAGVRFNQESESEYESEPESVAASSIKTKKRAKRMKQDYIQMLMDLWNDPQNHIDIYTVKYAQTVMTGNFTVSPLKTFENAKGAFILVESNFNAPARTSRS